MRIEYVMNGYNADSFSEPAKEKAIETCGDDQYVVALTNVPFDKAAGVCAQLGRKLAVVDESNKSTIGQMIRRHCTAAAATAPWIAQWTTKTGLHRENQIGSPAFGTRGGGGNEYIHYAEKASLRPVLCML